MGTPNKIIGWREWVALPDLGIPKIKVKVDTGARSSSLHALEMYFSKEAETEYVEFILYPKQKNNKIPIPCRCPVLERREVRSSNGQKELRPVIRTTIEFLDESWLIEMTLSNRAEMGIPMLLGREGIRNKFLVDAHRSFYGKRHKLNNP